jgi:hypothetical protein
MHQVVGSSPIIRSGEAPLRRVFVASEVAGTRSGFGRNKERAPHQRSIAACFPPMSCIPRRIQSSMSVWLSDGTGGFRAEYGLRRFSIAPSVLPAVGRVDRRRRQPARAVARMDQGGWTAGRGSAYRRRRGASRFVAQGDEAAGEGRRTRHAADSRQGDTDHQGVVRPARQALRRGKAYARRVATLALTESSPS